MTTDGRVHEYVHRAARFLRGALDRYGEDENPGLSKEQRLKKAFHDLLDLVGAYEHALPEVEIARGAVLVHWVLTDRNCPDFEPRLTEFQDMGVGDLPHGLVVPEIQGLADATPSHGKVGDPGVGIGRWCGFVDRCLVVIESRPVEIAMTPDDLIEAFNGLKDDESHIQRNRVGDRETIQLIPSANKSAVKRLRTLAVHAAKLFDPEGAGPPLTRWLRYVLDHSQEEIERDYDGLATNVADDGKEENVRFTCETLRNAASASALVVRLCRDQVARIGPAAPESLNAIENEDLRQRSKDAWLAAMRLRQIIDEWWSWWFELKNEGDADPGKTIRFREIAAVSVKALCTLGANSPSFNGGPDRLIRMLPNPGGLNRFPPADSAQPMTYAEAAAAAIPWQQDQQFIEETFDRLSNLGELHGELFALAQLIEASPSAAFCVSADASVVKETTLVEPKSTSLGLSLSDLTERVGRSASALRKACDDAGVDRAGRGQGKLFSAHETSRIARQRAKSSRCDAKEKTKWNDLLIELREPTLDEPLKARARK